MHPPDPSPAESPFSAPPSAAPSGVSPLASSGGSPSGSRFSRARRFAARAGGVLAVAIALLLLGPLAVFGFGGLTPGADWRVASRASTGLAPDPAAHPGAVVQVYAARTIGWRGAFAVHTWVATKRTDASEYEVHHVLGWRAYRGGSAVVSQRGPPDFRWFGAMPELLADVRGDAAAPLIGRIEAAIDAYPYADRYRAWPGPNSNTFVAFIARAVPELRVDLPPTAIGKDFLGGARLVDRMPSGTGWQLSLFGLAGVGAALAEGLEANLLGLSVGIDFDDVSLRLPGIGKWPGAPSVGGSS
ncbi:MAG: DUF3750 domain-containing protein [Lautropia sp.]